VIWPTDTIFGFHRLGYGLFLPLLSVFVIHVNFSYVTVPGWRPDPLFRLYTVNIHKAKHGSDNGTYDTEGRFIPQKFEDVFARYSEDKDSLTIWDVSKLLKSQILLADPVGWGGAFFECRLSLLNCYVSLMLVKGWLLTFCSGQRMVR